MSTSVASITNHFPSAENNFTTTLSSTISSGATTVPLTSVAGYGNGEVVVFMVDPADDAKKQTFTGVVDTSGVQITSVVWTSGTNQSHTTGSTVVDYVDATHISMIAKGLAAVHEQSGLLKSGVTVPSPALSGTVTGTYTMAGTGTYTAPTLNSPVIKTWDGWLTAANTWTYASATTFTVSGVDVTALFPVGTKIKLTQTTAKYFYVTASSFSTDTTVTITGGSDYTLANAAITSPFYSYDATPQGFPTRFNYTPTWTAQGTQPAIGDGTLQGTFQIVGKTCFFDMYFEAGSTSTFGTQNYYWNFPVAENSFYQRATKNMSFHGGGYMENNSVQGYMSHGGFTNSSSGAGKFTIEYSGTSGQASGVGATAPFTWGNTDYINFAGVYRLA